jgi:TM2 domain-containing membrane protein YozV
VTIQPLSSCSACGAGVSGPTCSLCGHTSASGWGPGHPGSAGFAAPQPPYGAPGGHQPPYGGPWYPQPPMPPVHHHHVPEKSAGVAVLLTFLWLGAGHLYLNRVTPGVLLLVLDFFLVLFFLFVPFIGWILGFLGWLAAFIAAAVSCSSIAASENAMRRPQPHVW